MNAPSLQRRIRNGTLLMLALVVLLGLYTLPRVYRLGGAIRATLYRNYVSIEAAQNMHAALNTLQVAEHDGKAKDVLPAARHDFLQWADVENHDFTEVGEPELAADITRRGNKLFDDIPKLRLSILQSVVEHLLIRQGAEGRRPLSRG